MKLLKYIALSSVLMLGMTSCEDWLDVNVDPDQPNNQSIQIQNRVPWILKQYTYSAGCANTRTFATAGGFYSTNRNMNAASVTWAATADLTTTPYQTWFVGTGSNIVDLYDKAKAENAPHYQAVACVVHALGFMEMLDLYGEMPYTEALGSSPAPAYSDGEEIFNGCIAKIDEAIELFGQAQASTAPQLSEGDIWNGGDIDKWIKLCYGLKARWLLKLSKKSDLYDPQAILDCLAKAPQSNADNTVMKCYDVEGDQTDFLLGDPIYTNGNWDYAAMGKNQWTGKFYYDLLTNMRGAGIEDPRMSKIIPASMTNVQLDEAGKVVSYDWRRSKGVDMYGDAERLVAGGPTSIVVQSFVTKTDYEKTLKDNKDHTYIYKNIIRYPIKNSNAKSDFIANLINNGYTEITLHTSKASDYNQLNGKEYCVNGDTVAVRYPIGVWYIQNNNYVSAGDTAYVNFCGGSVNTNNGTWGIPAKDLFYFSNEQETAQAGAVSGTGSFQIRSVSDFDVLTYYEMCFIKAEVLMRQGQAGAALAAYKEGIKAHMERMQNKLNQWKGEGYTNPDMWPMDEAQIAAYLSSAAVCQNEGQLKMSDIMLQKYVAMGWSIENYNDMRRFNFSAGNIGSFGVVYPGYGRTKLFAGAAQVKGTEPTDPTYWIRRWRLPATLELSYNTNNALAANANALETWVWCLPVWWDCATNAEYQGYITK